MSNPGAIKESLEQTRDEDTVNRLWQGIEKRRYKREAMRALSLRVGLATAGILIVGAIAVFPLYHAEPAALLLSNDQPIPESVVAHHPTHFEFMDGSQIRTISSTRFDVIINRKNSIEFALREGTMSFQVTPGGDRQWTIHCGEVDVIVVGTVFDVTRTRSEVVVNVHKGTVCVKGNRVPDGIQKLTAAMSLRIENGDTLEIAQKSFPASGGISTLGSNILSNDRSAESQRDSALNANPPKLNGSAGTPKLAPQDHIISNPVEDWKVHAQNNDFAAAYNALPAYTFSSLHTEPWSLTDLFLLSDIARITHHPEEACTALAEIIRRDPGNPRAGLAAYTLARVTSESLRNPEGGAQYYEQALALGISRTLRETALIRLVEVYRRLDPKKARQYENIYLADYPDGRYLNQINQNHTDAKP